MDNSAFDARERHLRTLELLCRGSGGLFDRGCDKSAGNATALAAAQVLRAAAMRVESDRRSIAGAPPAEEEAALWHSVCAHAFEIIATAHESLAGIPGTSSEARAVLSYAFQVLVRASCELTPRLRVKPAPEAS